jgi:hypothetical protein
MLEMQVHKPVVVRPSHRAEGMGKLGPSLGLKVIEHHSVLILRHRKGCEIVAIVGEASSNHAVRTRDFGNLLGV